MRNIVIYLCEIFGIKVIDTDAYPIVKQIPGNNKNLTVRYDSANDIEHGYMATDDGAYKMWWEQKGRSAVWS